MECSRLKGEAQVGQLGVSPDWEPSARSITAATDCGVSCLHAEVVGAMNQTAGATNAYRRCSKGGKVRGAEEIRRITRWFCELIVFGCLGEKLDRCSICRSMRMSTLPIDYLLIIGSR